MVLCLKFGHIKGKTIISDHIMRIPLCTFKHNPTFHTWTILLSNIIIRPTIEHNPTIPQSNIIIRPTIEHNHTSYNRTYPKVQLSSKQHWCSLRWLNAVCRFCWLDVVTCRQPIRIRIIYWSKGRLESKSNRQFLENGLFRFKKSTSIWFMLLFCRLISCRSLG